MSNPLELTGTIKQIDAPQSFASGFTKREFVITTEDKYPQDVKFEVVKDNCAKLDAYSKGDSVHVSFNVRGNEYNGKHYVSLAAWKIERNKSDESRTAAQQSSHNQAKSNGYAPQDDEDSIPF